VYIDGVTTQLL